MRLIDAHFAPRVYVLLVRRIGWRRARARKWTCSSPGWPSRAARWSVAETRAARRWARRSAKSCWGITSPSRARRKCCCSWPPAPTGRRGHSAGAGRGQDHRLRPVSAGQRRLPRACRRAGRAYDSAGRPDGDRGADARPGLFARHAAGRSGQSASRVRPIAWKARGPSIRRDCGRVFWSRPPRIRSGSSWWTRPATWWRCRPTFALPPHEFCLAGSRRRAPSGQCCAAADAVKMAARRIEAMRSHPGKLIDDVARHCGA